MYCAIVYTGDNKQTRVYPYDSLSASSRSRAIEKACALCYANGEGCVEVFDGPSVGKLVYTFGDSKNAD